MYIYPPISVDVNRKKDKDTHSLIIINFIKIGQVISFIINMLYS
jgi:hypothetical protein